MKTIHKYPVELTGSFAQALPCDSKFLDCQIQHGKPQMWFEVHDYAPLQLRTFHLVGTGQPVPVDAEYLATFQMGDGQLVMHLYLQPD